MKGNWTRVPTNTIIGTRLKADRHAQGLETLEEAGGAIERVGRAVVGVRHLI